MKGYGNLNQDLGDSVPATFSADRSGVETSVPNVLPLFLKPMHAEKNRVYTINIILQY